MQKKKKKKSRSRPFGSLFPFLHFFEWFFFLSLATSRPSPPGLSPLLASLFLPSVERKGAFLSKEPGCGDFAPFLELGRRLSNCSLALFFIWNFANAPLHCLSPRRVWKFAPGARPVSRPLPLPLRPFSRPRRLGSAQGCCRAWGNAVEQRPLDRKLKKKSSGEACSSEKSVVVRRRLARASKKNGFFSFFDLGRRGREHSSRRRPHSLFSLFFFLSLHSRCARLPNCYLHLPSNTKKTNQRSNENQGL